VLSFPNCKLNLGLHVVGKRADGFHNLETVFYPLPFTDALEIVSASPLSNNTTSTLNITGLPVAGESADNLCFRAWKLLKRDYPQLPAVRIHLHKIIPMGAGLGGGSADGAFALKMLNEKYQLQLGQQELADYALHLGSDCPFFIINKPCYALGRGELLEPISLDLSAYSFLIVHPEIYTSTAKAFAAITPKVPSQAINDIVKMPPEQWKSLLKNDFEEAAFLYHPELQTIKQDLYNAGAVYASMTGSGSCFYGIFPKNTAPVPSFKHPWKTYRVF
jgi:4-diphosphocytidyl-2-C-methyl-D-erythritol kinase